MATSGHTIDTVALLFTVNTSSLFSMNPLTMEVSTDLMKHGDRSVQELFFRIGTFMHWDLLIWYIQATV